MPRPRSTADPGPHAGLRSTAVRRRRARAIGGAGLLALLGTVLVTLDVARVDGISMEPTLCDGATLLLVRAFTAGPPVPDALVVLDDPQHPGQSLVKRVAGIAGQRVLFVDGGLVRDGRAVDEPWVDRSRTPGLYTAPVDVPAGTVYVLGDNREASIDSRQLGPLPVSARSARVLARTTGRCPR